MVVETNRLLQFTLYRVSLKVYVNKPFRKMFFFFVEIREKETNKKNSSNENEVRN